MIWRVEFTLVATLWFISIRLRCYLYRWFS